MKSLRPIWTVYIRAQKVRRLHVSKPIWDGDRPQGTKEKNLVTAFDPTSPLNNVDLSVPVPNKRQRGGLFKSIFGQAKKGTWLDKNSTTSNYETSTSRRLRESLNSGTNLKRTRNLLFKLIDESPNNLLEPALFVLVDKVVRKLYEELPLTIRELHNIFLAVSGPDPSHVKDYELVTTVFSMLYGEVVKCRKSQSPTSAQDISDKDFLLDGNLYFKYLRHKKMMHESKKLLSSFFKDPQLQFNWDENVVLEYVRAIVAVGPEVDSLLVLYNCISQSKTWHISPELIQELITNATDVASKGASQDLRDAETLISRAVLDDPGTPVSIETIIIALDSCLTLNSKACGERILRSIAIPRLKSATELIPSAESRLQYYELLLLACIKFSEGKSIGDGIVKQILDEFSESELVKETWDILSQWSVYQSTDPKRFEEVLNRCKVDGAPGIDQTTMNGILSVATGVARRSRDYIEEILKFFSDMEIRKNVETYSLLINYYLEHHESAKALELFHQSISDDGCQWDSSYLKTLDYLIIGLAQSPPVDTKQVFDTYFRIRNYTAKVGLDAQYELLSLLLAENAVDDVGRFIVDQYGRPSEYDIEGPPTTTWKDCPKVIQLLYDYIMAQSSYRNAWLVFKETNNHISIPPETYLPIMEKFCHLGRPDAALEIWKFWRMRVRSEGLPPISPQAYQSMFRQFGFWKYWRGVYELHIHSNVEIGIERDAKFLNAKLAAYSLLGEQIESQFMLAIWEEIKQLPQPLGVNNETIDIMLHGLRQFDINMLEHFWLNFPDQFGLKPTEQNLIEYIKSNCSFGYYVRALDIAKDLPAKLGIPMSPKIIEGLYNWTLLEPRKQDVRKWAEKAFPDMWNQLVETGRLKNILIDDIPQHANIEHILQGIDIKFDPKYELNEFPEQTAVQVNAA